MTHYETLGVPPTASSDEIKAAYRRLARQSHPDVDPSPAAEQRFRTITDAYRALSDARQRLRYNESIVGHAGSSVPAQSTVSPAEIRAAWHRVGAYGVTGLIIGFGISGFVNWLIPAPPPLVLILSGLGGLMGTMRGIDANFVTSDFLPRRWQRIAIRSARTLIWMGGLGSFGGFFGLMISLASVGSTLLWLALPAAFGLIGAIIAFRATLHDH